MEILLGRGLDALCLEPWLKLLQVYTARTGQRVPNCRPLYLWMNLVSGRGRR